MKYSKRTCQHPLFQWASDGDWSDAPKELAHSCVFVFERSRWLTPTPEQLRTYDDAEIIVESLGGQMRLSRYEIAGTAHPLSKDEVADILQAVVRDNPGATVISHWNGEGCYTISVGVEFRDLPDEATEEHRHSAGNSSLVTPRVHLPSGARKPSLEDYDS